MIRLLIAILIAAQAATTRSTPERSTTEPAPWNQMRAIDARAAHVHSLKADFEQRKFTPLMKQPLVSRGTMLTNGDASMWDTRSPEPTRMLVTDQAIELYYPTQSAEEIYPIAGKLGLMASSPLPRLDALKQFFDFEQIPVHDLDPAGSDAAELALQLTPTDSSLREHVRQVRVLLERSSGLVKIAESTDPDGERTRMTFSNVQVDPKIDPADLTLSVPPGTTVSHPLGDSN